MARRVLFAVHDWGLGHATRSLVLIRALLERGDAVTILMAESPGLALLRTELGDACEFHEYEDLPKPFSRYPAIFYLRMSLAVPRVWLRFELEQRLTERLVRARRIDAVVSDSRLGVWSREVPSYCLFHSLRQIIPGRPAWLERAVERAQRHLLKGYRAILVPDVDGADSLAGDLAHDLELDWGPGRLVYLGPLSELGGESVREDIDYFFSISGVEPTTRCWRSACSRPCRRFTVAAWSHWAGRAPPATCAGSAMRRFMATSTGAPSARCSHGHG